MTEKRWPGEVQDLRCPEPGCDGKLTLKESKYGLFYGCGNWRRTGCRGSHGAHDDGAPLGKPADGETKRARMQAHSVFDQLWKGPTKTLSRKQAYAWMQRAMNLSAAKAHIGMFTIEQCEELCRACQLLEECRDDRA